MFWAKLLQAIAGLYANPTANIKSNGSLSATINLKRGTRQGCPLSPLLFAIVIEPLAHAIRMNYQIEGIKIKNTEYKISLFADDILLYVTNPLQSIPTLLHTLTSFGEVSGLCINHSKSQILLIHISEMVQSLLKQQFQFSWVSDCLTYLGIKIPLDLSKLIHHNHNTM